MIKLALKTGIIGTTLALAFTFVFTYYSHGIHPGEIFGYLAAEMGGATTGAEVLVEENPYNQVAQQLAEKEEELEEREEELGVLLDEREAESNSTLNLILGLVVALFLLLVSNFYLDFKARNKDNK